MRRIAAWVMAVVLILPAAACAAGKGYLEGPLGEQSAPAAGAAASPAWSVVRALCALVVVIGLIVAASRAARRFLPARMLSGPDKLISVVECEYLSPKSRLFLVCAAGEYLLLSLDHSGTRFLARLDTAHVAALREKKAPPASQPDFGAVMGGLVKHFEGKRKDETCNAVSADIRDIHREIEKIRAMRDDLKA